MNTIIIILNINPRIQIDRLFLFDAIKQLQLVCTKFIMQAGHYKMQSSRGSIHSTDGVPLCKFKSIVILSYDHRHQKTPSMKLLGISVNKEYASNGIRNQCSFVIILFFHIYISYFWTNYGFNYGFEVFMVRIILNVSIKYGGVICQA